MSNSGIHGTWFVPDTRPAAQFTSSQEQTEIAGKATVIDEGTTPHPIHYEKAFRLTELNITEQLELTLSGPAGCAQVN
jgi:hypothetical protein